MTWGGVARSAPSESGQSAFRMFTDECCELHRAGIEDPFPPDLGECQCTCNEMHPAIAACVPSAPARRILRIGIEEQDFHLPVCQPYGQATATTYGA